MSKQIKWFPGHMSKARREISEKIKLIDIVVELVDARAPLSSKNPMFDQICNNKQRLIVMTKKDLADDKVTALWIEYFKSKNLHAICVNLKNFNEYQLVINVCKEILKEKMEREAKRGLKPRAMRAMILGIPNVGKSTFLNRVIGEKIAIMSDKAQTTRNKIQGIYTRKDAQIVFIDTPGIHKPHSQLGDFMVQSALSTLNEVDAVLFMVNATQKRGKGDDFIIERLKKVHKPIYLVINKIDKIHPDTLLDIITEYKDTLDYKEVYPISALQGNNVPELIDNLVADLPEGPQYYPDDQITDHPERFIAGELIREKVLQLTREEVPHSVAVVVDRIKRETDEKVLVQATIIVERPSQKGIIIGNGGKMLKEIGIRARKDIELMLGDKVYLELWVKVQPNWKDRKADLAAFGYKQDDYDL